MTKIQDLRANAAALRTVPMVQSNTICQALYALIDALEEESSKPYDAGWNHTIPDLADALDLFRSQHPANVISVAINTVRSLEEEVEEIAELRQELARMTNLLALTPPMMADESRETTHE